tara:strand:- start:802 stop:1254 length:453 start_codon:yes stop_codon:yes gene_type:complete
MMDSNFTPYKVVVDQALQLPTTFTRAFMVEQPERFIPFMNTKSQFVPEDKKTCPECFLLEHFGKSDPEEMVALFFRNDMELFHFMNVINYLTDFEAVAFIDEGSCDGDVVVVNYPHKPKSEKGDCLTQWAQMNMDILQSASDSITIKVES